MGSGVYVRVLRPQFRSLLSTRDASHHDSSSFLPPVLTTIRISKLPIIPSYHPFILPSSIPSIRPSCVPSFLPSFLYVGHIST